MLLTGKNLQSIQSTQINTCNLNTGLKKAMYSSKVAQQLQAETALISQP